MANHRESHKGIDYSSISLILLPAVGKVRFNARVRGWEFVTDPPELIRESCIKVTTTRLRIGRQPVVNTTSFKVTSDEEAGVKIIIRRIVRTRNTSTVENLAASQKFSLCRWFWGISYGSVQPRRVNPCIFNPPIRLGPAKTRATNN